MDARERPMGPMGIRTLARRTAAALLLGAAAVLLGGCPWDEPEIEDLWTRLDFTATSVAPGQSLPQGPTPITVGADITYRSIVTGFAVAELRGSTSVNAATLGIHPDAARERMAYDIDFMLANSVTLGRATRAVTGWDRLIQHIDFSFTGNVPAMLDSTGAPTSLFLVCYLGSGTEIELPGGADSLVVTPFAPAPYQLLPIGMELQP
jgi:hypothetical protein